LHAGAGLPAERWTLAGIGLPTWQNEQSAAPFRSGGSDPAPHDSEFSMSKRGRKRKSRKKNGANHGNRPNA